MRTYDLDGVRVVARRDMPIPSFAFANRGRLVVLVRSESEELDEETCRLVEEEVERYQVEDACEAHIDEMCRSNPHM